MLNINYLSDYLKYTFNFQKSLLVFLGLLALHTTFCV